MRLTQTPVYAIRGHPRGRLALSVSCGAASTPSAMRNIMMQVGRFREGDKIDAKALKALIRPAVALNTSVRATARPVRSQK
jgi:hypothetical protein